MNKNLTKLGATFLSALFLFGCQNEEEINPDFSANAGQKVMDGDCYAINFEEFTPDNPENLPFIDHVTTPFGKVRVHNTKRSQDGDYSNTNVARVYDTKQPTGDDAHDLGQATMLSKILVANQFTEAEIATNPDGTYSPSGNPIRIAGPNDNAWGATMELDFSEIEGSVMLNSIDVVDIDESPNENQSFVRLVLADNSNVDFPLATFADEGHVQTVDLRGTKNVKKLMVILDGEGIVGSGGIDNIMFCVETMNEVTGCTRTQGYWKNHATGKKKDATWGDMTDEMFFSSGMTYLKVLETSPKGGDAYLILAHQYIAAKLNVMAGASMPAEVQSAYDMATAYFNGTSTPERSTLLHWAEVLDKYNNGKMGVPHCDE